MGNPWNSETAREAAAKSAQVRKENKERRANLSLADRVRAKAAAASEAAMKDLIEASKGAGDFADLPVEKRYEALKTLLAYGIGRPPMGSAPANTPDPDEPDPEPEEAPLV